MDSSDKAPAATQTGLLTQFRTQSSASRKQVPLSMRERYVLWASGPIILLCPWHGGSMLWWSTAANFALALLPFIVAFIPLRAEYPDSAPSYTSGQVLKNLLKFPIFWLGLLFLGYIAIQGLNYSWEFMWTANKRGFYMQQLPEDQYIHWLPSGMKTPFNWTNSWQALLMWGTPWLVICAMWSTFRRAKSWRIVLWMVASLGVLLALLGIAASITAPDKIFWIWDRGTRSPFGPFTYRNQASVMLYMAMAAAFSLFFYYQRTQSRDTGIQWVAMLLGVISLGGSIMSFSRAGWVGTAIVLIIAIALFVLRLLWQRDHTWKQLLLQGVIFLCILGGIGYFVSKANIEPMMKRWEYTRSIFEGGLDTDSSIHTRKRLAEETLVMFSDNSVTGWGANSFRFYFPVYQQGDERLTHPLLWKGKDRLNLNKRIFWTNSHSDWAQILAEYGIIGSAFLLLGLFYWWGSMAIRLRLLHCEHWILLAATLTMILQSGLDIVFYNPALVIAFSLVICCARGMLIQPPLRAIKR